MKTELYPYQQRDHNALFECPEHRPDQYGLLYQPNRVIAVLKIIFDCIESLKSWGIILDDEEPKQNRLTKTLRIKK